MIFFYILRKMHGKCEIDLKLWKNKVIDNDSWFDKNDSAKLKMKYEI